MTRDQAFQLLGLPAAAEAAAIGQKYADLKAGLAAAHAAAPTPGLKAKHQQAMNQMDEAFRMAMAAAPNHPLTAPHISEPSAAADPRVDEIIRQNQELMEELRMLRQAASQPPVPKPLPAARPTAPDVPAAPDVLVVGGPEMDSAAASGDGLVRPRIPGPIPRRALIAAAAGLAVLAAGGIAWKMAADQNAAEKSAADAKAAGTKAAADKAAEADASDRRRNPDWATKGAPFVNGPGMKFVPVTISGGGPTDGKRVFFSIWETREQDYAAFATATKRSWDNAKAGDTHPAVNVSWEDATAFCQWLTTAEQTAGRLKAGWSYRLPSDHEWSCAVGLKERADGTPSEKSGTIRGVYPWGEAWPPPKGAGNYYGSTVPADKFATTSPAGSFDANPPGLFDLGGNAWEWCQDPYSGGNSGSRVLRGGSWGNNDQSYLLSSRRNCYDPGYRYNYYGFRVVVVAGSGG